MIKKWKKQEIIDKIIKLRPFYYLSTRKGRFSYAPIKTIIFYFLCLFNLYSPIKVKIKARTIFGDEMYGYSSTSLGSIYYLGFQDPELTLFLIKNLNPGDIFIDGGSSIGYYSLLAKNLVSPGGKVYSFEPTPRTYSLLKDNTKTFSNIYINPMALFDKKGIIDDFVDYGIRFDAFNTLFKRKVNFLKGKGRVIKIETETLDNFCRSKNIAPTIIKLDTEGSESLVLKGAAATISNQRPLVVLEVGEGEEWKENSQKSLDFLLKRKYKVFELNMDGNLMPHKRREIYEYNNLVFIPEESINFFINN